MNSTKSTKNTKNTESKKNKKSKKMPRGMGSFIFYATIAWLTVAIMVLGSLPYILNRRNRESQQKNVPGQTVTGYPRNGDGVDPYGRPTGEWNGTSSPSAEGGDDTSGSSAEGGNDTSGSPAGEWNDTSSSPTEGGNDTSSRPAEGGDDTTSRPAEGGDELRGVWVAYSSLNGVNRQMIDEIIAKCKANSMNTVFLHVRPFGDALYKSEYYPWSHLATGTQGVAPDGGFDPLAYAVEAAHREGIALHAWLNPLRIMLASGVFPPSLSDDNPYNVWRNDGDPSNDDWVIDYRKGKFYNPAIPQVRELIVNGTREIVERYNVDGIHWDDYFYPASDGSFNDSASYSAYQAGGGTMSLIEWRTQNINELVRAVYSAVKSADSTCRFGISPAGNIENCLSIGADVYQWGSRQGYVDYLIPQVYWSSDHSLCPFEPTCRRWNGLVTSPAVKLYIGLALYKAGSDSDGGKWLRANDIMKKQVLYTRSGDVNAKGFVLYSYDYLDSSQTAREMKNLRSVLN